MRINIISDIGSEGKSIIPYGLHLGKHKETEVMIHHVIDPRTHQGTSTPYADSQSITPGNKMSHDEIIEREKFTAGKELDKLLSAEASRLNYPLKYSTSIDVDSLYHKLKEFQSNGEDDLCVASLVPNNSMVSDLSELMENIIKLKFPLLLVPSGYKFKEPAAVSIFTDYSEKSYEPVVRALQWMDTFPLTIKAFSFSEGADLNLMETDRSQWEDVVNGYIKTTMVLDTKILKSKKTRDHISEHMGNNLADLVMFPRELFKEKYVKLKKNSDKEEFLSQFGKPVLIY